MAAFNYQVATWWIGYTADPTFYKTPYVSATSTHTMRSSNQFQWVGTSSQCNSNARFCQNASTYTNWAPNNPQMYANKAKGCAGMGYRKSDSSSSDQSSSIIPSNDQRMYDYECENCLAFACSNGPVATAHTRLEAFPAAQPSCSTSRPTYTSSCDDIDVGGAIAGELDSPCIHCLLKGVIFYSELQWQGFSSAAAASAAFVVALVVVSTASSR